MLAKFSKAAVLSFIDPYADQFIDESRSLPIIPDLFETGNVDLAYPELLRKCVEVTLDISDEHVNKVELNTRDQARGSGLFDIVLEELVRLKVTQHFTQTLHSPLSL